VSLTHNEQTKLTATALNNIAVAFVVAGFVAPVVGFGQAQQVPSDLFTIVFNLAWLLTGFALHLTARLILRRLRP
jgi:hypothetical protein